jgi:hypothetical protein
MLFLNPWLLAGLAAVSIPIIIHLVRQQAAKPIEWGAMRFLFDTIAVRRRKMEWEDLLLMATRCLLLGLVALAVARPFVAPDSTVPWLFVLPAALLGIALLGGSFVLSNLKARWLIRMGALTILALAGGLVVMEKFLNLKRFEASGRRDVALVVDASASMELLRDGKSVFAHAVDEAKQLVKEAPRGTAFTIILGGPAPEILTAAPVTQRADVLGILDSLQPIGGTFRAHEALGMATLGLAEGTNASKEIVVFTDSQRGGWRFDNPGAWNQLEDAWKAMPTQPKLLLRDFGSPLGFRNLALSNISVSRSVIGTDREVTLRLNVENTGDSAITPGPVILEIGGRSVGERPVGMLVPGQSEMVEFRHRFDQAGPQAIEARIDANDDLATDNRTERVISVRGHLPVLLVDGNPAGSFFDRATGYSALALAPSAALIGGKAAGETFLMDPRVVSVTALRVEDLEEASVIMLADVSRLQERLAHALSARVYAGAGLLIVAGPRADADFYNEWQGPDGTLTPVALGEDMADAEGIAPAASTFVHEALELFEKGGDLETALVRRWRKTDGLNEGAIQAAAFSNGDVFLASRSYGRGRTLLATCSFDARSGNLPARRAFVPLVHELVTWAAGSGVNLNVAAAWSPQINLAASRSGLAGSYYKDRNSNTAVTLRRIDPVIDFSWGDERPHEKMPRDNFAIVWQGMIIPPTSGEYVFESEVDDRVEVRIGDHPAMRNGNGGGRLGALNLTANKPLPIRVNYEEDGGTSTMRLFWIPPGGERQIIPTSSLIPSVQESSDRLQALDPRGLPREASIRETATGRDLAISGPAVPGTYQVSVGNSVDGDFEGIENGQLPVVVLRDPSESYFEAMQEDDIALIRKHIDLLQPTSVADILGVLEGRGFGREIWKWLAIPALLLFMLESLLARWVSKNRRTAEDVRVEFGEDTVWRGGNR